MLTKKDFKALAEILNHSAPEHYLIEKIADYCASVNPAFKRELFYEKSGMTRREEEENEYHMLELLEKREALRIMRERLRDLTGGEYPE